MDISTESSKLETKLISLREAYFWMIFTLNMCDGDAQEIILRDDIPIHSKSTEGKVMILKCNLYTALKHFNKSL